MMQRIAGLVKDSLPKFNDNLLVDLRKREVNGLIDFIAERYRECAMVADPNLELINYEVLSPVARLNYELSSGIKKNIINIRDDECVLVSYNFRYHDKRFEVALYVPYLYENSTIVVNGINYECFLNMTEKLFSIRTTSNGITIKVIRSPISCWRNTLYPFNDVITGEYFIGNIVTCKIHYKKVPKTKKAKPTIIHYLLCKFTLPEVLMKFGLPPDAASFVEQEPPDENFYYFKTKNIATSKDQIFLKVNKQLMTDKNDKTDKSMLLDITTAILYMMNGVRFVTYQELIHDSKTIFMIILGKLIFGNSTDRLHAHSYMVKHIASADTYLDNYTKDIFKSNGIIVNDIYELLIFVAKNIGQIIVSYPNNNMYNKRIEAVNNVIIDSLISTLYYRIYHHEKKPDIDYMTKAVIGSLKVTPKAILKTLGSSDSVRFSPAIYSDNWLLSIGDKVVKRLSAATKPTSTRGESKSHGSGINAHVNKFHPSMIVVESAIGFTSRPGANCLINPYAIIDEIGGFVRDEFAEETSVISKYLTNDQNII